MSLAGYDAHLACEAAPAPKTMEEMEKDEIRANEVRSHTYAVSPHALIIDASSVSFWGGKGWGGAASCSARCDVQPLGRACVAAGYASQSPWARSRTAWPYLRHALHSRKLPCLALALPSWQCAQVGVHIGASTRKAMVATGIDFPVSDEAYAQLEAFKENELNFVQMVRGVCLARVPPHRRNPLWRGAARL